MIIILDIVALPQSTPIGAELVRHHLVADIGVSAEHVEEIINRFNEHKVLVNSEGICVTIELVCTPYNVS